MKKIDLGQTMTVLANIGVIIGIVFLVFELDQNNKQLRAQAQFNYMESRANTRFQIAFNPEVAELLLKPVDSLTELEQGRRRSLNEATVLQLEWEFGQMLDGNLSENRQSLIEKWRPTWRPLYLTANDRDADIQREAWARLRSSLREDFVVFWEQEIIDSE